MCTEGKVKKGRRKKKHVCTEGKMKKGRRKIKREDEGEKGKQVIDKS